MMKAVAYLLAGAALLPGLVSALDPAPQSALTSGWKYKGCYSDRYFDGDITSAGQGNSTTGVATQPRALNGYFSRQNANNGANCINICIGQNKGYTFAATNDNQCWCDISLAPNMTMVGTSTTPGWGILMADTQCQQGCRISSGIFSTTEACGAGGTNRNTQRISVYEYAPQAANRFDTTPTNELHRTRTIH
ncbi:hypothetical protein DE146DRAFT_66613 [Phaeosphaeria sp. MPI-PUGE-AT-0046c]|nr:hypothetical protein DE146DRAFT_66613 [Phaeosphaeria sp. MPI-PUGE-AT-0046c]